MLFQTYDASDIIHIRIPAPKTNNFAHEQAHMQNRLQFHMHSAAKRVFLDSDLYDLAVLLHNRKACTFLAVHLL